MRERIKSNRWARAKSTSRWEREQKVAQKVISMRGDGMSWRKIERRLRLNPAHGMTAVRYARSYGQPLVVVISR